MLHQVGVSFDLYYDARKHKIKILIFLCPQNTEFNENPSSESRVVSCGGQTDGRMDRHTDGRTDRPDETDSRFSQFWRNPLKSVSCILQI